LEAFVALGEPDPARGLPRLAAWRTALGQRASVHAAVAPGFGHRLEAFLRGRGSELSRRVASRLPAGAPMV
jgi:glutathione S-transferase